MNNPYGWRLENSYAGLPEHFFTRINPTPVNEPQLLLFNADLAKTLGIDLPIDEKEMLAQLFSGNTLPENVTPIAQA
jgi:uncharacterized protein YdiU (UPF0061 family)